MNFWKDKSPTKGMIYELMKEWKKSKNRFPFCIASTRRHEHLASHPLGTLFEQAETDHLQGHKQMRT